MRLTEPTNGQVLFDIESGDQEDIAHLKGTPLKDFRAGPGGVPGPVRVDESQKNDF